MNMILTYQLLSILLFIFFIGILGKFHQDNDDDDWMHQIVLDYDNNFHVKWKFNNETETIWFNVCVLTKGWFGLGLSSNGQMVGSDVVIVWIDQSGQAHIQDRFAKGKELPLIDDHQDWLLEFAEENETHTCAIFKRHFVTCDHLSDLPITNDVIKLIWAYHQDDPFGPSALLQKHSHHKRGHRSVHLLNHKFQIPYEDRKSSLKSWDIRSSNFTLPENSDTTYWCKIVSPSFKHKAHVVRVRLSFEFLYSI